MTASDLPPPDDGMTDREGLAAEYVLGSLPLADRATAERLIATDAAFAASVNAWQNRLSPLNDAYAELAPPPGLLARVEARLFPAPAARRAPGRFWLGALTGLALAGFAALVLLPPLQRPAAVVATLTGAAQPLVVAARYEPDRQVLTVTRDAGPVAATGQDYELWVIPEGKEPVSLGVLRDTALSVTLAALPAGSTLAVTLETAGGSPTGKPQGPLLVAAVISG